MIRKDSRKSLKDRGRERGSGDSCGEMLHSKAPLIKVHEHTGEDSIGREETLLQSARVCVCVFSSPPPSRSPG